MEFRASLEKLPPVNSFWDFSSAFHFLPSANLVQRLVLILYSDQFPGFQGRRGGLSGRKTASEGTGEGRVTWHSSELLGRLRECIKGIGIPRTEMEIPVQGIPSEGTGEDKGIDSVTTSMPRDGTGECMWPNKQCFKLTGHNEHSQQLFPRLPNEITFGQIVPRLPWTAFHLLAAVSRIWRRAIRDHRVHEARVNSCSTNTLLVHGHDYDNGEYKLHRSIRSARVAVYSVRDKLCYDLPPIPGCNRGVPWSCECVSLDGRIYVLGGAVEEAVDEDAWDNKIYGSRSSSSKVYVLDLAWASHWIECASMERGRQNFGCAVLDGKIYVLGGTNNDGPARGAEVYDPKVNSWSPIAPMTSLRYNHGVYTGGEQLLVHGGRYYHPSYLSWKANGQRDRSIYRRCPNSFGHAAKDMEVYNPTTDRWTVLDGVGELGVEILKQGNLFRAHGMLHLMHENNISVYEDDGSWTFLTENEFPSSSNPRENGFPLGSLAIAVDQIVEVESSNELLAGVIWYDESDDDPETTHTEIAICQSEGFDTEITTMAWNVVSRCPGFFNFMHCIQL